MYDDDEITVPWWLWALFVGMGVALMLVVLPHR